MTCHGGWSNPNPDLEASTKQDRLPADLPDPDLGRIDQEKKKIDSKLMLRVDLFLVPWLAVLYCLSFICRTNIGNAKLQGMEEELGMTGIDYNISLTVFFVSYAFCDPVVNAILKRVSPRVFFTAIMIVSGIIVTLTGLCKNYSSLLAARFFLGVAQSGMFPGVNYYMSCWYTSTEIGLRSAIFFSAAALAGSFSGLLAAAIAKLDHVAGLSGWSWIFILEGIATFLCGVASWWMIYDWPSTARFLSPDDRIRLQRRILLAKQITFAEGSGKKYMLEALKDWKTYAFMAIYAGCLMPLYALSLFMPTIIQGLGYSGTMAQLLTVPPYACATVATIAVGFIADHTRCRGFCNAGSAMVGIVGFVMLLATPNPTAQYIAVFFGTVGIYPAISNTLSWVSNNTEGSMKRGTALGMVIGWGTLNGAVSSNIYISHEKPRYITGHAVILAYLFVFLLCGSVFMHAALSAENRKKLSGQKDQMLEGLSEEEISRKGDKRPDFLYTS